MNAWFVFLVLTARAEGWPAPTAALVLRQGAQALALAPSQTSVAFSDARTPSCAVLQFRIRQWLNDLDEIDRLLLRLRKKSRLSSADLHELNALQARRLNVHRELSSQFVIVQADFAWPAEGNWSWVNERRYRLQLRWQGLDWAGFDAAEPDGFSARFDGEGLHFTYRLLAADACAGDFKLAVEFARLESGLSVGL